MMSTNCRVNSCCCGCSLRTGSLAIAILDMLSALFAFIYAVILVSAIDYSDYWDEDDRPIYYAISGVLYTLVVMSSIMIITDILLLVGILGGRARLLVPWLMYTYVNIVLNMSVSIWVGVTYINEDEYSFGYSTIISAFFSLGFKIYFLIVVRSYAQSLAGGVNYSNGVNVTVYPSTLPQAYPNGQQPFYPNVNVQQTVYPIGQPSNPSGEQQTYPNGPPPYPSGQQQTYPNGQQPFYPNVNVQQTVYPIGQPSNPNGQQQMYPNGQAFPIVEQTYPNNQVPGPSEQPPPYSSAPPQMSLPPMSEMKRDL